MIKSRSLASRDSDDENWPVGSQSSQSGPLARDQPPGARPVRDGLYQDLDFPLGKLEMQSGVEWKRPKEIDPSAKFLVDGASRLDICQGQLGDCWVLSAIASLAMHPELLKKVVPVNQSFQDDYNGSFTFSFWQYGEWEDVTIDDLLPTQNNTQIYLRSPERHEFWSSLLEKAYAKLKGGYRALELGFPHEAMVDMTGGVTEVFTIPLVSSNLPDLVRNLLAKGALINCANSKGLLEQKNKLGILFKHAYSLTAIERVKTTNGFEDLVRILNPWGNTEWIGPWSDMNSKEWKTVSPEEQKRLGRVSREDGEFWMSVSDFQLNFDQMDVCHLTENPSEPGPRVSSWRCVMHHGTWMPGITAGGGYESDPLWQKPQFLLVLSEVDIVPGQTQRSCSFVVALMQKNQRRKAIHHSIGLYIYQAHPHNTYLSREDLHKARPLCYSDHSIRREVVIRSSFYPGRYIIIASTITPNTQGEFLLRVLTEPGNVATPAHKPPQDVSMREPSFPHLAALPPLQSIRELFKKHSKKGFCKPLHLLNLLTEALQGGVLAGSEQYLSLEHCKSLVALMDSQGKAKLSWQEFQSLWDRIRKWTDIFLVYDKNKTHHIEYEEVKPALAAAGIVADDLLMQLVGLRYTEPNKTISYPGFLYLLMKLETMSQKFQAFDMMGLGTVSISYRQWLWMTMYN